MARPWEAEQTIEPQVALRLIQEQFGELHARKIRLLGVGWDNTAFVVDEDWIFRFPRREIALPLLEAEWCALPKIARHLPLPIPVPKWKGEPSLHFPWSFIGYKMLKGFTACYANLSDQERSALAEPIARFLAILHAVPIAEIAHCHVPGDNKSRIDAAKLIPKIEKTFEELALLGLLENRERLESFLEPPEKFRPPQDTHVVHGDFYVRHLLVDEKHKLCGVIDWGDLHIGDRAIDIAIAHAILPIEAHEAFKKAYGGIDEATWKLARLRAISSSSYIVLFGFHSNDPDLLREGLRSLSIISRA